jgi:hypothetical protein
MLMIGEKMTELIGIQPLLELAKIKKEDPRTYKQLLVDIKDVARDLSIMMTNLTDEFNANKKKPAIIKHPKEGSMLEVILEKFPTEGAYTIGEILALVRENNPNMQNKKDSSLKTVMRELVKEPVAAKVSPHINRYACLRYDVVEKKYQRIE